MSFDYYTFSMNGEMRKPELFRKAFLLALEGDDFKRVPGKSTPDYYSIVDDELALFWYKSEGNPQSLPYVMDAEGLCDFAWNWLKTAPRGEQPDHDGHNEKGWKIYNNPEGYNGDPNNKKVWNRHHCIVVVKADWCMYGK